MFSFRFSACKRDQCCKSIQTLDHQSFIVQRQMYYSISGGSQRLVVHFVPFSKNVSLHGPVIHKISSHIGSPVIGRCCPAQHHVVFNSLQQGHASGPPRDSWKEKQPHMTTMPSLYDLTPLICTQGSSWTCYMLCPHQPQAFRNVRYNRWSTYAVSKKWGGRFTLQRSPASGADTR